MKHSLPTRKLPDRPDLGQLKRQAKELLDAVHAADPGALAEAARFYRDFDHARFALHDAQLVLARSYGFDSWPKLKAFIDGIDVARLLAAVRAGKIDDVAAILRVRPELVNIVEAENNEHTALHYAVFGPMPEMVRLLMRHGANPHAGISPHTDATSALTIARDRGLTEIAAIILEEEKRREAGRPIANDVPGDLRNAIRSADEARAIAILEQHPELVHVRIPPHGWTFLHAASAMLLTRLAIWLLDHGAAIGQPANDGSTPLDVIGRFCDSADRSAKLPALVGLLCERGTQITARSAVILGDREFLRARHADGSLADPRDDRGWLLQLAVEHDRPDMLEFLLDLGLDPNARARVDGVEEVAFTWGMPLYHCVRYNKRAMAEMLLARGADPNAHVYASGTPLSEAYGQRDDEMVALLERYGGKSNASMAGLYRRPDLARKLLAEYGDTRLPDDGFGSGTVAEQLAGAAARGGDPEILQMAIDRLDIPRGDPRWASLLTAPLGFWNHWIGPWCHQEWDRTTYLTCFKMILERCGPLTGRLRFGATILHEVAATGDHLLPEERAAFATMLLDAGAPLHLRDDLLKSTPLGWAARWGRIELVRLFLDRGADPREPDAEPWATPLAWAERMGRDDVVALLRRYQ